MNSRIIRLTKAIAERSCREVVAREYGSISRTGEWIDALLKGAWGGVGSYWLVGPLLPTPYAGLTPADFVAISGVSLAAFAWFRRRIPRPAPSPGGWARRLVAEALVLWLIVSAVVVLHALIISSSYL